MNHGSSKEKGCSPLDPSLSLPYFHTQEFLRESGSMTTLRRNNAALRAPIFIVGCPRSGTTLLGNCLANHSKVCGANESLFLLDMWRIMKDLHRGNNPRTFAPLAEYITEYKLLEAIGDFSDSVFKSLVTRSGKMLYIDHTPWYIACIPLIYSLYRDCIIIHILRDGRQVTASLQHSYSNGFHWAGSSIEESATLWSNLINIGMEEGKKIPINQYIEIHYEDLCENPEQFMQKLLQALDLEWNNEVLHPLSIPHANPSTPDPTLSNILPDGSLQLRPRKNTSRWPRHWSLEDREKFLQCAGNAMQQSNYSTDVYNGSDNF